MKLAYLIPFCLFLNIFYSQDQLYNYERIDSTLHAWQDMFGYTSHPSDDYEGFGVIYNLDTIGYSSQDNLPIYAVKLSANADIKEAQPRVLIMTALVLFIIWILLATHHRIICQFMR